MDRLTGRNADVRDDTRFVGERQSFGLRRLLAENARLHEDGRHAAEVRDLLARTEGLAFLKGKWVEVNHERLNQLLDAYEQTDGTSLPFFEALRQSSSQSQAEALTEITRGAWLEEFLASLQSPEESGHITLPASLDATLRPYQETGFSWLTTLAERGLGACLADDMAKLSIA